MQTRTEGWARDLKGTEVPRRRLLAVRWPAVERNSQFDRKKISGYPGSQHQGSHRPNGPPSTRRMIHRGATEVTATGKGAYLKRKAVSDRKKVSDGLQRSIEPAGRPADGPGHVLVDIEGAWRRRTAVWCPI